MPDQTAAAAMPSPPQPQPQQWPQQPQQWPQPPQPGPAAPPPLYQAPPKKSGLAKFTAWVSGITAVLGVIIVGLIMIGGSVEIATPVITTAWQDGEKLPSSMSTVRASSEVIYAVVETNVDKPTEVTAKWYVDDEHVGNLDTVETVDKVNSVLAFHITTKQGFPAGKYRVEIWTEGKKQTEREFTVK